MHYWLLFHRDLAPDVPEAAEVMRFQQAAAKVGIKLSVLQPQQFDLLVDASQAQADGVGWSAIYRGQRIAKPDFIIARTGSETSYFTLAVLRHFERQGVPMVNGPAAIEAVADKLHTLQILAGAGLPIPKTILGKFPVDVDIVERELGFPVVVKTLRGTRGNGVLLCSDREQFNDLATLLGGARPGADFIFQQYIKTSHGRDVRVLVVNGRVIAAMERRANAGGFKSNISSGGHGTAFDPPEDMAQLAINVATVLGLDVAGIDILFDEHGYRICEANSSPGFQGLEAACRISVPDAIFNAMHEKFGLARPLPAVAGPGAWHRMIRSMRKALGLQRAA